MFYSKKLSRYKTIKHCFFNARGGFSDGIYKSLNCGAGSKDKKINIKNNLTKVCKKIGCKKDSLVLLNQVHSNKIYFINKPLQKRIKGDGLLTNKKNIALGILTADCAPVFIYDPKINIISAVHAGWKGAYRRIISKTLNNFKKKGSSLRKLIAVIGPCIGKQSYEIKKDFFDKFIKKDKSNENYFCEKNKKIFFSLNEYIKNELVKKGVENIEIIKKDTFNVKNNFFSARRSLKNKNNDYGRNISIIMIK